MIRRENSSVLRVVIVEEHHEAFFVWLDARRRGWSPIEPVTLLHVDEFADLGVPRLSRPVRSICDVPDAAAFTYSELTRNNYIWPAVYDGWFDNIVWLRVRHSSRVGGPRRLRIAAQSSTETSFLTTDPAQPGLLEGRGTPVRFTPTTIAETLLLDGDRAVVSIDASYFCQDFPASPPLRKVEVTAREYGEFINDRYHFLRLALHCNISPFEIDGRYYLVFNDGEPHPAVLTGQDIVAERIDGLVDYLRHCGARIGLVVLARSCYSGLVDSSNADFVERRMLARLGEHWPLQIHRGEVVIYSGRERPCEVAYA